MFKILLITLIIFQKIESQCNKGCLKCNEEKQCQLCDTFQKYKLDVDKCMLVKLENCTEMSLDGKCLSCSGDNFVDPNTFKCLQVENEIPNCALYSTIDSCQFCVPKYYINKSQCIPVPKEIPLCLYQKTSTECAQCENNSLLSEDNLKCEPAPPIPNCASFSYYQCDQCQNDYLIDQNYYFKLIFQFNTIENLEILNTNVRNQQQEKKVVQKKHICQKKKAENCVVFETFDKCQQCKINYYRNQQGQCEEFPEEEIPFCLHYEVGANCKECIEGYRITMLNTCVKNTKIKNCAKYNTNSKETECLECDSDYYVQNKINCLKRINSLSIENCSVKNPNEDLCQECNSSYLATKDFLKCLPMIQNCKTHNIDLSDVQSQSLVCSICSDFHYMNSDSKKCEQGNVEKCLIYEKISEQGKEICKVCEDSYYLENKKCVKQTEITNCSKYSPVQAKLCDVCDYFTINVKLVQICEFSEEINNCLVYKDKNSCETCESGYFLKNAKQCDQIPLDLNCFEYDGSKCLRCNDKYMLQDGQCVQVIQVVTISCEEDNIKVKTEPAVSFDTAKCEICEENAIPLNYQFNYICYEKQFLKEEIENCNKYQENQSCQECQLGYVLKNKTCETTCENGTIKSQEILQIDGSNLFYLERVNLCMSSISAGCMMMSPSLLNFEQVQYKCGKCKEDMITMIDPQDKEVITQEELYLDNYSKQQSPVDRFPQVTCHEKDSKTIKGVINPETLKIKNCKYYYKLNDSTVGCLRCNFGFYGDILKLSDDDSIGYIESCLPNPECDTEVKYQGIGENFQKFVSCHKCINDNHKPFFAIKSQVEIENFIELIQFWRLNVNDLWTNQRSENNVPVPSGKSSFCAYPIGGSFGISPEKFNMPDNCAIFGFNPAGNRDASDSSTSALKKGSASKMSVYCAACEVGYAPQFFSHTLKIPVKCTKITNCKLSTWLNACSECEENFTYEYKNGEGVLFHSCISNTFDPNCHVVELFDQIKNCKFCKIGFTNNKDGLCENILAPKCKDQGFVFRKGFSLFDLGSVLYLQSQPLGCSNCETNYFAQKLSTPRGFCTPSEYIKNSVLQSQTIYIPKCKFYMGTYDNIKCKECHVGYIVDVREKICYHAQNHLFCLKAQNQNVCDTCIDQYISVNGKCVLKTIKFCMVYRQNPNQPTQACEKCDKGYYLNNNICLPGKVEGCEEYEFNRPLICNKCLLGHYRISKSNTENVIFTYCFPIESDLNCLEYTDTFGTSSLNCKTCKEQHFIKDLSINQQKFISACLPFNQIKNCQQYERGATIDDSTFKCSRCSHDYFSKDFTCTERQYLDETRVQIYNPKADEAQECRDKYYLDRQRCRKNPTGKIGCVNYMNFNTCIGCKRYYYLQENECLPVREDLRLHNCLYYESLTKCKSCEAGFYPGTDGKCERVVALDCDSYESITACKTCKVGYGIQMLDGVKHCMLVNKPNCLKHEAEYPWNCLECKSSFFPNSGDCSAVLDNIPNCVIYDSASQCRQCSQGTVLSVNRLSCIIKNNTYLDEFCLNYKQLSQPICSTCNSGYFFEQGRCVMCKQFTVASGCFSCNPYDSTKCIFCKIGYYMNSDLECIPEDIKPVQEITNQGDPRLLAILTSFIFFLWIQ